MKLKLIKFSASWCNPCKMQKAELENNPIGIDIQEIDSTAPEDAELVQRYKIMSIPNMIIINTNDEVMARFIGYTSSDKIKEAITKIQEESKGRFVVIEDFNGTVNLATDPDSGDVLIFETFDEAEEEAKKCQNGKVVKLWRGKNYKQL